MIPRTVYEYIKLKKPDINMATFIQLFNRAFLALYSRCRKTVDQMQSIETIDEDIILHEAYTIPLEHYILYSLADDPNEAQVQFAQFQETLEAANTRAYKDKAHKRRIPPNNRY